MTKVSPLAALYLRWRQDLGAYGRSALRVLDKQDNIVPLRFNPMQLALHDALERQLAETGRVRAIILKARQLGCSSFVAARFFAKMHLEGARAYLLAHEDDAAKKIASIYRRFWDYHPAALRLDRTRASDHELMFSNGGRLEAATASTPGGGRSGTVRLYHGSEVAFWLHAAEHSAGSMNQLAKSTGSEMILESTANGPVGSFYERWRAAVMGRGDFIALFFPWFIDPQYVLPAPAGFTLSYEAPNEIVLSEVEYQEKYGLSLDQMAWRRAVIDDCDPSKDGALEFAQEYPADETEAWLGVSGNSLLSPAQVDAARRRSTTLTALDYQHPLVLGLDPAPGHGASQSVLAYRRARKAYQLDRMGGLDAESLTERVYRVFVDEGAARLCIDTSEGTGQAVFTSLNRRQYTAGRVVPVQFGGRSRDRTRFYNKRAQLWSDMSGWVADGGCIVDEVATVGGTTLATELLSVRTKPGSERVVQLESKADVIKRLGRSPDGADALACTFDQPDPSPDGVQAFVAGRDGVEFVASESTMPARPHQSRSLGQPVVARVGRR